MFAAAVLDRVRTRDVPVAVHSTNTPFGEFEFVVVVGNPVVPLMVKYCPDPLLELKYTT